MAPGGKEGGNGCLEGSAFICLSSKLTQTPCQSWSPALNWWRACALLGEPPPVLTICSAACSGLLALRKMFHFPQTSHDCLGTKESRTHFIYMSICGSPTLLRNPIPEMPQESRRCAQNSWKTLIRACCNTPPSPSPPCHCLQGLWRTGAQGDSLGLNLG